MNNVSNILTDPSFRRQFEASDPKDREINDFIIKNYILVTNVKELGEAEIVCLGELHSVDMHKKINARIIDYYNCEGSLLLIEETSEDLEKLNSNPQNQTPCNQDKYVRSHILVKGWDADFDEDDLKNFNKLEYAQSVYENPQNIYVPDRSKISELENHLEENDISKCSLCLKTLSFFCNIFCVKLFIKCCTPCIRKKYKKNIKNGLQHLIDDVPRRNQNMQKVIEKASEVYRKIFVIAGSSHFRLVPQDKRSPGINYQPVRIAVEQIRTYLKTKKFAILIPKANIEPFDSDDENEESKVFIHVNES